MYKQSHRAQPSSDIAVIGMSCRFPGASNYHEFWKNLINGVCSIRVIPSERWNVRNYYSSDLMTSNRAVYKWGSVIDDVDLFDHQFFNISHSEAANMDPQHRILLEETWRCIEDSGVAMTRLQKQKTAVFVGTGNDFLWAASDPKNSVDAFWTTGSSLSNIANHISYIFDFHGESLTLDTACASSLAAIHQAKRSLCLKECDFAIAAGVQFYLTPIRCIAFNKLGILSPDGCCRVFDKDANGTVIGEGIGVLLLQCLENAIKDRHHIYGIIKGTSVNHVGHTLSIATPSVEKQKQVVLSALEHAGIHPDTITFVETHGIGTATGDAVEVEALTLAFRQFTDKKNFCRLGAVKSNIGHTGAAAGVAGVIKVLMMMQYRQIPQNLNFKIPNPLIDFDKSPFLVAEKVENWHPNVNYLPLRAGVSAYGYTGVNAHVVIEEFKQHRAREIISEYQPRCFLVSAKTQENLKQLITKWRDFIDTEQFDVYSTDDICYTLMTGRQSFPFRFGCYITHKSDLEVILKKASEKLQVSDKKRLCLRIGKFSNTGFFHIEPIYRQFPIFRNRLNIALNQLAEIDKPLCKLFWKSRWEQPHQALYSFVADYALATSLIHSGIDPDMITCDSSGIWTCMALLEMISFKDAIWLINGYTSVNNIKLSRPKIPFFDPVAGRIIYPISFDDAYFLRLIRTAHIHDLVLNNTSVQWRLSMTDASPIYSISDDFLIAEFGDCKFQIPSAIQIKEKPSDFWSAIVHLWINGQQINWETIAQEAELSKKPLPVYPFAGERFPVIKFAQMNCANHLKIPVVSSYKEAPLSFYQYRCWRNQIEHPSDFFYNVSIWFHIEGQLDINALTQSIETICRRHESMRTIFPVKEGRPVQRIYLTYDVPIAFLNLEHLSEKEQTVEIEKIMAKVNTCPFNLEELPLTRLTVIQTAAESYRFGICQHHIITDAISFELLLKELSILYNNFVTKSNTPLPDLPLQYSDFSLWQHQYFTPEVMNTRLNYWEKWLLEKPSPLVFPFERQNSDRNQRQYLVEHAQIDRELIEKLKALSCQVGTTVYMTILAAFAVLIFRVTGCRNPVIGIPHSGRSQRKFSSVIGLFATTLLIRIQMIPDMTFLTVLRNVKAEYISALKNQDIPYEHLEQLFQLKKKRPDTQCRIFVNMLDQKPGANLKLAHLSICSSTKILSRRDLVLNLIMGDTSENIGMFIMYHYKSDQFFSDDIVKMLVNLKKLLETIATKSDIHLIDIPGF